MFILVLNLAMKNSRALLQKAIKESGEISVYAGISVCPYVCKFCRYSNRTAKKGKLHQMLEESLRNLTTEINIATGRLSSTGKITVSSVYIGGGTPSLMAEDQMRKLFDNLEKFFNINGETEITMECTPDTITQEKLKIMKNLGVNRISMGAQWLDDEWLKSMNRRHSVAQVFKALALFNQNDIKYNVDFIYGFGKQGVESFCDDLNKILEYRPTEITLYRFEDKKRTDDKNIKIQKAGRKATYTMQEAGRIILGNNGYTEGPAGWFTKKDAKKREYMKTGGIGKYLFWDLGLKRILLVNISNI